MSSRDRSPVRTSSSRQPSGKDPWNSGALTLTLLQLEQTSGSSGRRGTAPPTEPGFSQGFFSVLTLMEFWFLAAVASGLLSWDTSFPAISLTWLHRYYLNWTDLDDAITKFNNEMPSTENIVFNLVIFHWHTIFLVWYCAVALTQFVWLKALHK